MTLSLVSEHCSPTEEDRNQDQGAQMKLDQVDIPTLSVVCQDIPNLNQASNLLNAMELRLALDHHKCLRGQV